MERGESNVSALAVERNRLKQLDSQKKEKLRNLAARIQKDKDEKMAKRRGPMMSPVKLRANLCKMIMSDTKENFII